MKKLKVLKSNNSLISAIKKITIKIAITTHFGLSPQEFMLQIHGDEQAG